jgi:hypothetical protein
MGKLFGGSSSESKNVNNGALTSSLMGSVGGVGDSMNAIKQLLSGDTSGFDSFKKAGGFDFASRLGAQGILGNGAARGLLRSGATGQGLVNYGQNMANQYLNDYFAKLTGQGQLGLGAAGVLADSGRTEKSSKKDGLGGLVGAIGSKIAASDPRLKENIIQIGYLEDGLPLYTYNYIWDDEDVRQVGVMAPDVAAMRPWAVGPKIGEYDTVDYGKLGNRK